MKKHYSKIVQLIAIVTISSLNVNGINIGERSLPKGDSIKYVTPRDQYDSIRALRKELPLKERYVGIPEEYQIKKNLKILPLPVIFSSSEVGAAFGANVQGYWHFNRDLRNQQSSVRATAVYTLYNQYFLKSFWDLSFNQDNWRVSGQASYNHFPIKYYGVGNEKTVEKEVAEYISQDFVIAQTDVMTRLNEDWFIGALLKYSTLLDVFVLEEDTEEYSGKVDNYLMDTTLGNEGYNIFGAGLKIVRDTRDNTKYAYKGSYFQFSFQQYMGSMNFINYILDYRKYWTIGKNSHIASMAYLNTNSGEVPYKEMPGFGQDINDALSLGRGYYYGRYIDNSIYYTQTEFRYPVYKNIRGVIFAGLGDVASSVDEMSFKQVKFNYGGGLRIPFDEPGRIYLRLDIAFAPKEPMGFYLKFAEAF